jgi:phosphoglycerol transferase MdoB-like AlkP superfamily enzyme
VCGAVYFFYFAVMDTRPFSAWTINALYWKRLLSCGVLLMAIHLLLRIWFWISNRILFTGISFREGVWVLIRGMQQDWISLLLVNLPVIILLMWRAWTDNPVFRRPLTLATRWLFITGNILAVALNCIDIGYFRFGRHRANIDLGFVLGDSIGSFGSLVIGYWSILLLFIVLVFVLFRMARLLPLANEHPVKAAPGMPIPRRFVILLLQAAVCLLLLLSTGLPGRPVIPATPLLSVSPRALPIAQNSLLTFTYSWTQRSDEVKPVNYFTADELSHLVRTSQVLQKKGTGQGFQQKNVVLFILESFSRCYLIPGDLRKARTPFFDSLLRKSIFFPHSFANGYSSNQGIVAILGGLPAFTDEPFFYSSYANTPLHSIGNILKEKGYNTNFLMGAPRDHFGFGKFAHMAGLDHTYWRDDFDDDRFYDGNWGIFDQPFLQYGAGILGAKKQPFLGVFFTISAHPPYTLPDSLRRRFTWPGQTAAQNSISYTDYAFSRFFADSQDKAWFRNTIFVFCADHWLDPDYGRTPFTYLNTCTIPIFIYDPSRSEGELRPTVAGQVDLAPTILDLLGYNGSYAGFGKSLLDTSIADSDRYVVNRLGGNYQIITDRFILGYDQSQERSCYFYRYAGDSALKHDLINDRSYTADRNRLERLIKANIQAYSQSLNRRSLE